MGVAWMTPISSPEPTTGNRHFSSSWPAFSRLRDVSPRLKRLPRKSRLYVGQSFASPSARHVDGKHGYCKDDKGQHRAKSGTRHDSLHARAFAQSSAQARSLGNSPPARATEERLREASEHCPNYCNDPRVPSDARTRSRHPPQQRSAARSAVRAVTLRVRSEKPKSIDPPPLRSIRPKQVSTASESGRSPSQSLVRTGPGERPSSVLAVPPEAGTAKRLSGPASTAAPASAMRLHSRQ